MSETDAQPYGVPEPDPGQASAEDLTLAITAIGDKAQWGGLLSCALAGIYAERGRTPAPAVSLHPLATPGGRRWLANLLTQHPTPETLRAVIALLRDDAAGTPVIEYAESLATGQSLREDHPQGVPVPAWVANRRRQGEEVSRRTVLVLRDWQAVDDSGEIIDD